MSNETTKEELNNKQNTMTEEDWSQLIKAVHHNGMVALKMYFEDVEGQMSNVEAYGPIFIFHVKDESEGVYSCGFFLRELVAKFQSGNDPAMWMASFFFNLMETKGGKTLPKPAASKEEANAIMDKIIVPQCIKAVKEEFAPEQVHAGLAINEQLGPVFEVGFPTIKDGNNVCAIPLHLLLTNYQLNRDPAELLIQGLYKIKSEHSE